MAAYPKAKQSFRLHKGEMPDIKGPPGSDQVQLTLAEGVLVARFHFSGLPDELGDGWFFTHDLAMVSRVIFTQKLLRAAQAIGLELENSPVCTRDGAISYDVGKQRYAVVWNKLFPKKG